MYIKTSYIRNFTYNKRFFFFLFISTQFVRSKRQTRSESVSVRPWVKRILSIQVPKYEKKNVKKGTQIKSSASFHSFYDDITIYNRFRRPVKVFRYYLYTLSPVVMLYRRSRLIRQRENVYYSINFSSISRRPLSTLDINVYEFIISKLNVK